MKKLTVCLALAAVVAVGMAMERPAAAESHAEPRLEPLTWISFVRAKPGQGDQLVMALTRDDAPVYDALLAEGQALGWGVAQQINHFEGDSWSHVQWVTFPGWAGVDAFLARFFAHRGAMSEEDRSAMQESWQSMVEPGSHFDAVVRHKVFEVNRAGGQPRYLTLNFHKAKPGSEGEMAGLYHDFAKPVMARMLSEGTIGSYGMYVAELHGDPRWSHVSWHTSQSLAAFEKVTRAFYGAMAEAGDARRQEFARRSNAATVPDAHQDRILVITHFAAAPPPSE